MQLDCRHLRHPAKQQVMQFSLDRVVNPLSRLVYASNCGGLQPSQINCVRHECLGVSSPPVESNSPGCSDEAAGATGIVVRRTGVRREPSITRKWLSIRKTLVAALRRHEGCDRDDDRRHWWRKFGFDRRGSSPSPFGAGAGGSDPLNLAWLALERVPSAAYQQGYSFRAITAAPASLNHSRWGRWRFRATPDCAWDTRCRVPSSIVSGEVLPCR
jgi:hypothetical protein